MFQPIHLSSKPELVESTPVPAQCGSPRIHVCVIPPKAVYKKLTLSSPSLVCKTPAAPIDSIALAPHFPGLQATASGDSRLFIQCHHSNPGCWLPSGPTIPPRLTSAFVREHTILQPREAYESLL